MKNKLTHISLRFPWIVIRLAVAVTIFFAAQFPKIKIDTDPQNMLKADEPARLFDAKVKEAFALHDMIAVGIVEDNGAFRPDLLNRIYKITADIEKLDGVIVEDILAPSTVDDIKQGSGRTMVIEPLMGGEIETQEQADYILSRIKSNPVLRGKLASDDAKPLPSSYRFRTRIYQRNWPTKSVPSPRSTAARRSIMLPGYRSPKIHSAHRCSSKWRLQLQRHFL